MLMSVNNLLCSCCCCTDVQTSCTCLFGFTSCHDRKI